jgi:hypothetical protein
MAVEEKKREEKKSDANESRSGDGDKGGGSSGGGDGGGGAGNDVKLNMIVVMGFSLDEAKRALKEKKGNVELAIFW